MSLRIIKPGILDTIQDGGRYGYQHQGIHPGGSMDRFSARLANALLGKFPDGPVIEIHFPAPQIRFEIPTVIALTGADFSPVINGIPVPLDHPIAINSKSNLQFSHLEIGARCYLSVLHDFKIEKWFGSYSTNVTAGAGGYNGQPLRKDDRIEFSGSYDVSDLLKGKDFHVLPWKANDVVDTRNEIECLMGNEWNWLTKEAQQDFLQNWFLISNEADRMGYRLNGAPLAMSRQDQLVSSAVTFGTIQLLPDGQLIILMADHATTGGYPRIANVISAHLPILAQKKPNSSIRFKMVDLPTAEKKVFEQKKYLQQSQNACKFRMNF
jgi:antagonist of KipI